MGTPLYGAARARRRWAWVTAACWTGAAGLAALSGAWLLEGAEWVFDLAANLNAQWLALGAVWGAVCLVLRRRGALALTMAACVLLAAPLMLDRAALTPREAATVRATAASDDAGAPVRVLHYNARSEGTQQEHAALMERTGADVVSLLAPDVREQVSVIYGDGLENLYPGKLSRRWRAAADGTSTYITAAYVVSRWAITPVDVSYLGEMSEHLIAGRVERPGAPFGVIALHPRSPRTRQRWVEGNLSVDAAGEVARRLRASGLPVIVIADLNSTPSGARCRSLCARAGLKRAKPLLLAAGTYPESWPLGLDVRRAPTVAAVWPTTLAIDDVWVGPEARVTGWSCLEPLHSEHRPILVDVVIPPGILADK